jgi:hypothetical protein
VADPLACDASSVPVSARPIKATRRRMRARHPGIDRSLGDKFGCDIDFPGADKR